MNSITGPYRSLLITVLLLPLWSCQPPQKSENNSSSQTREVITDANPIATIESFIAQQKIDKTQQDWKLHLKRPPLLRFNSNENYDWLMHTNKGDMTLRFYPEVAPMHVSNAIYLSKTGFYDHLTFHRVIPGFMAQGGDPLGNGEGGPGYMMDGEFSSEASHSKAGILSTANAGPGTDGSQFFITFTAVTRLDGGYTVFGELIDGMDTLKKLEQSGSRPLGVTSEKLEILSTEIKVSEKTSD